MRSGAGPRWLAVGLIALPTLIPVGAALLTWLRPEAAVWGHLLQVVLPEVARNTLLLMLLVMSAAGLLGTGLAWLTSRYHFPGRSLLHASLLLPLALPGYVLGFVTIAGLDYAGPVQALWREWTGYSSPLWQIRSLWGAALVLSLSLYPYVYLAACNAFRSISPSTLDLAATLGEKRLFRRIALPLALPWVAGGMLLVGMEVLADFGTVALFNVPTFTTAIYRSWFGLFALDAALQLAAVLVLLALLLMQLHARVQNRGGMRQDSGRTLPRKTLQAHRGWAATAGLLLFVGSVVGLPVLTLLRWSMEHIRVEWDARYLIWLGHSLQLAAMGAALILAAALLGAGLGRRDRSPVVRIGLRLGTLGYALPGTLIAVGLFAPLAALERGLGPWISPGWLTQSLLLVLLGYWARFLAVAHTPLAQQLTRIRPSIDEVSRTLGVRGLRLLGRVHVPLISGAMGSAAALLVIDIIKEMPITLMTRPSGFDTLATRVFELTAEGEYERAALPALTIVLAGLLPVALLLRLGHKEPGNAHAT